MCHHLADTSIQRTVHITSLSVFMSAPFTKPTSISSSASLSRPAPHSYHTWGWGRLPPLSMEAYVTYRYLFPAVESTALCRSFYSLHKNESFSLWYNVSLSLFSGYYRGLSSQELVSSLRPPSARQTDIQQATVFHVYCFLGLAWPK